MYTVLVIKKTEYDILLASQYILSLNAERGYPRRTESRGKPSEIPCDVITMTSSHHDLVLQSLPMYRQHSAIPPDFDNIWTYEGATCDVRYYVIINGIIIIILINLIIAVAAIYQ